MVQIGYLFTLIIIILHALCTNSLRPTPPEIAKQPPNGEILFQVPDSPDENLRPFIIECEASGSPEPRYHWLKNGQKFHWQAHDSRIYQQPGRGTLVVTVPRDEDVGQYQCVATNELGTAISNSVFVHKSELDSFDASEPEIVTAEEGKPFKLPCNVPHGYPKPKIEWLLQSSVGVLRTINTTRLTVDPEGALWFSAVARSDKSTDTSYTCAAYSAFRNEYKLGNRVHLNVSPAPRSADERRVQPVFQYVSRRIMVAKRGETLELWCIYGGSPQPSIQWQRLGGQLPLDRVEYSNYLKTLRILNVRDSDEGMYECNVTNDLSYPITSSFAVRVFASPYFTKELESIHAAEGETVELKCEAAGTPTPVINWIHNGKPIEEAPHNSRRSVNNNKIVIRNFVRSDIGNYGCNASNPFGYVYKDVFVNVITRTVITTAPLDTEVPLGSNVTLRCEAVADSALKLDIQWKFNGEPIDADPVPRQIKLWDNSLYIGVVTELESGIYLCVARTEYDNATAAARLVIQNGPESPELLGVDCSEYNALIQWKAPTTPTDLPVLSYVIQFSTSFKPGLWEIAVKDVPGTVPLSPWANYTFRVIANNRLGSSLPSTHSEACRTPEDVPYKNPDNVKSDSLEPQQLRITWTPLPEIEHNAPQLKYRVEWRLYKSSDPWNSQDVDDWRANELVIYNQASYQPYLIRVKAFNQVGESNVEPKIIRGLSGQGIPTQAPSNLSLVIQIDSRTAVVTWNSVPFQSLQGKFEGYKVDVWNDGDSAEEYRTMTTNNSFTKAVVDRLKPFSKNLIRVSAFNSNHNGPYSNILEITTGEGTPGPVDNLEVRPLGKTALFLTWDEPIEPNGILIGYRISYSKVYYMANGVQLMETEVQQLEPSISDPELTRAILPGLEPNTTYSVFLAALTKVGAGVDTAVEARTFADDALHVAQPSFIWDHHVEASNDLPGIIIRWLPAFEGSGRPGSQFYVQYRLESCSVWNSSLKESKRDFSIILGLEPDALYKFQVVSVDGLIERASNEQSVITNSRGIRALPSLGRLMRDEFILDPNFIQLNHGSYGTYPKTVQVALRAFQDRSERNPELWFRRDARIELDRLREELAKYLNADSEDIVMVPNATGGINAVFRSLLFKAGEKIMHFSTIYGAMKSLIQYISDSHNGTVIPIEFEVNYPMSNAQLLQNFTQFLDIHHSTESPIRIALVDHISSTPAVINPIKEMIQILKARNILVIIDGAHAVGQIPIDLRELQADYYVTNCHKWMYAARGSSVLYVDKAHQAAIHPAIISSNYAVPSRFQDEFFWTGTIDYSSYMTVPAALEFRRRIGEDVIRNYTHQLALQGGQLLAQRLGTQVLQEEEQMGSMVDVALPINNPEDAILKSNFWIDTLLDRFNVYAAPHKHNGKWWIRCSAQIYNDISDFEAAADVFNTICSEVNSQGKKNSPKI